MCAAEIAHLRIGRAFGLPELLSDISLALPLLLSQSVDLLPRTQYLRMHAAEATPDSLLSTSSKDEDVLLERRRRIPLQSREQRQNPDAQPDGNGESQVQNGHCCRGKKILAHARDLVCVGIHLCHIGVSASATPAPYPVPRPLFTMYQPSAPWKPPRAKITPRFRLSRGSLMWP